MELIDLIIKEKYSLSLASQIVGVKLSTAKYILKAYTTDKKGFLSKIRPKRKNF